MTNPSTVNFCSASTPSAGKILIASHTSQRAISEQFEQGLSKQSLSCFILNEDTPKALNVRANYIEWCDVFVVIISRLYQRALFCMEALNCAKDKRKSIIAVLAEPTFPPCEALGAIAAVAL
mgnify:CR=1 FL=1